MKKFSIKKISMVATLIVVATSLFTWVVMSLWNAILPAVLGVKAITFLQALGILVLSKILFGGFKGYHGGRGYEWRQKMKAKWETMTPEERDKFKAEWKNRCGGRWGMMRQQHDTGEKTAG